VRIQNLPTGTWKNENELLWGNFRQQGLDNHQPEEWFGNASRAKDRKIDWFGKSFVGTVASFSLSGRTAIVVLFFMRVHLARFEPQDNLSA
jgi:hypothetical protein